MDCRIILVISFIAGFTFSIFLRVGIVIPSFLIAMLLISKTLILKRMETQKSATIVICAHNEEKTIRRSVESALNQDYKKLERIVIVDDGSTDETSKVVEEYAEKDGRIVLLRNETNLGKFRSMLKAIENFHSDVYVFIDADNEIPKDYVSYHMKYMENLDMIETPLSSYGVENFTSLLHVSELHLLNFARFFNIFPSFTGRGMFIRREVFEYIIENDIRGIDDGAVMNSVASKGFRYAFPFGEALKEMPTKDFSDFLKQRDRWYTRGMYEASLKCAKPYLVAIGAYTGFSTGIIILSLFSKDHSLTLISILTFLSILGILGRNLWSRDLNVLSSISGVVSIFFINSFLLFRSLIKVFIGRVPTVWYKVSR